jgi:hypothetical protein
MPNRIIEDNTQRKTLEAVRAEMATSVSLTIADTFACQKGDVLGVISATGLGRRRTRQPAAGSGFGTSAATGQVADASVFAEGDVLKNAAGTTIGTIAAGGVNTQTNVLTLTGNAAVAVAAGADVLGSDGSQVAQAIADKETDGVGDTSMNVLIGGFLVEANLRGLDATAKAELGGVSTVGGIFKF